MERIEDVGIGSKTLCAEEHDGTAQNFKKNAIILAVFATLLTVVGCVITVLSGETFEAIRGEIVVLILFLINFSRKSVWGKIVAGLEKV
jgi:membrane protein YqaA with SNARE-associated domain